MRTIKRASTLFLKSVLVVIGIVVFALTLYASPHIWVGVSAEWPGLAEVPLVYSGLLGVFFAIVPFLFALFQAFKLLQYIDRNNAFSDLSIKALKYIKYCAICMTVLYATALPLAFMVAELDDAPGLVLIATAFAGSPLVVATFAAVLQKLIQSGVDLKSENDLTV